MKTMKFKFANGAMSPQHPSAKLGHDKRYTLTQEVVEIPDDVLMATVLKLFSRTCDITWLTNGPGNGRHSFKFSELGEGRIIRV